MTDTVPTTRDVRLFVPAIAPQFSKQRAIASIRRVWRGYWDYQARRATGAILYALDDRTLIDIGIRRGEIGFLLHDQSAVRRHNERRLANNHTVTKDRASPRPSAGPSGC